MKLSEAPSFGESIINYDATSKAINYLHLAQEIRKIIVLWHKQLKKQALGFICIIERSRKRYQIVDDKMLIKL
jgi:hypothetical protein